MHIQLLFHISRIFVGHQNLDAPKFGAKETPPKRFAFVPLDSDLSGSLQESLMRFVKGWLSGNLRNHAVSCFLAKELLRIADQQSDTIVPEGSSLDDKIDVVRRMRQTCLSIQGPPGAGKTYTASHLIAALVKDGKTVGITSNSHKAINNLLIKVAEVLDDQNIETMVIKVNRSKEEELEAIPRFKRVTAGSDVVLSEQCRIVGGTTWAFANEALEGAYEYLFVDEAGQVSLAKLASMALSAQNFVFLGDQMQLGQPINGKHPGKSGMSILDYCLESHATVPPDRGIFLDRSFRMHPDICRFISDRMYEGRLGAFEKNLHRAFKDLSAIDLPNSGIAYIPVEHEGNSQASEEEISVIAELTKKLIGQEIYDDDKNLGVLSQKDILYVAPYNMQVRKLKDALGEEARIGTVDKFQGQEAAVVILSMCASNADSARGIDFLLNKNRLNVAISRAQTLSIVVGHPGLATTFTTDINKMALVNLYGLLVKASKPIDPRSIINKKETG